MPRRRASSRRPYVRAVLVAAVLAAACGAGAWLTGAGAPVEDATVALRFALRPPAPPADVAVVGIDAATFDALAPLQWPFPRTVHARVLDRLRRIGVRSVVYDIQFTEKTTHNADWALYRAVARFPGTVLATTELDDQGRTNVLGGDERLAAIGARAALATFPTGAGGVISRVEAQRDGVPTVAVAGAASIGRRVDPESFDHGGAWIDFRGPPGTIPHVSFADVYNNRPAARALRGKVVVVGMTSPTLHDTHPTPAARDDLMAGPEVQANALWTALHGLPLRSAPWWATLSAIALLALLPALAALRLRMVSLLLAPPLGAVYAAVAWLAFRHGWMLPVVAPLLALALGAGGTVVGGYVAERRERRRVAMDNAVLEQAVRERTAELHDTQLEIVHRLARAAESRDEETGNHIERIGISAERLGLAAGLSAREAELLRHAAVLHDVGKIGIPDRVLRKAGPLDDDEWETMKTHAEIGATMLAGSRSALVRLAEDIARTHHERWDGSGYPAGMRGEDIPLAGRICALCDVFDALLSPRPYKDAWPVADAMEELRRGSGRHFDPRLTELFLEIAPALAAELHGAVVDDAVPVA